MARPLIPAPRPGMVVKPARLLNRAWRSREITRWQEATGQDRAQAARETARLRRRGFVPEVARRDQIPPEYLTRPAPGQQPPQLPPLDARQAAQVQRATAYANQQTSAAIAAQKRQAGRAPKSTQAVDVRARDIATRLAASPDADAGQLAELMRGAVTASGGGYTQWNNQVVISNLQAAGPRRRKEIARLIADSPSLSVAGEKLQALAGRYSLFYYRGERYSYA